MMIASCDINLSVVEAHTKPQSSQLVSRYQLRCHKKGNIPLEEFITKAHLVVGNGYESAVKRTTLV